MIFKNIDLMKLFQMMKEHDVAELSLGDGKTTIEVKRKSETTEANLTPSLQSSVETIQQAILSRPEDKPMEAVSGEKKPSPSRESLEENIHIVQAPLVGTFYRASAPGIDPFIEVGDQVRNGDVLCIVEAMKSMNEIQAEVNGVVKEICVNNAELVEYDQALFKIEIPG